MGKHSLIYMVDGVGREIFNINKDDVELVIWSKPTFFTEEETYKSLLVEEEIIFTIKYKIPIDLDKE